LRRLPELHFILDHSQEYTERIEQLAARHEEGQARGAVSGLGNRFCSDVHCWGHAANGRKTQRYRKQTDLTP
jgi:hypothetical protein